MHESDHRRRKAQGIHSFFYTMSSWQYEWLSWFKNGQGISITQYFLDTFTLPGSFLVYYLRHLSQVSFERLKAFSHGKSVCRRRWQP